MSEVVEQTPQPIPAPAAVSDELNKIWQEYLQKCCEVGQIQYQLEQMDSQRKEIEKNLEVTQRAVKSAATKHRELQRANLQKLKIKETEKEEASH